MTISQKIIFSSTLVAILAALAAFMGWKNTQPIQNELVKNLTHTTEEIRFLDDIKENVEEIQYEILAVVKKINNGETKDLKKHAQKGNLIDIRIKTLKVQIQAFSEFNKTVDSKKGIDKMLLLSEDLERLTLELFPINNKIPTPILAIRAGVNTRKTNEEFSSLISSINIQRFSSIKLEGEKVNEQISKLNFWILLVGGLTFLLAIVFGRVIAANLSTEIEKLKDVSTQLNNGNYSVRVGSKSNDEFGKLGQTFDGMAANLEQAKVIEDQKAKMEKLNTELKVKNDSLDRFVYRVSHDLKAPIVNIKSLLSLIKLKISALDKTEISQPFFFLEKSAIKLEQTILDLLEVSRIEKSLKSQKKWVDLELLVENIKAENSEKISTHQIKFITNFKVPQIYFSDINLDSILSNLISNSIKYSSPKRLSEIYIETEEQGDFVCLKIEDNGVGIDLDKHGAKLFGMFNRFHNHVEGSGVGLYIVKKIVEESGGKIDVKSQVDQGLSLSIYFKRQDVLTEASVEVSNISAY